MDGRSSSVDGSSEVSASLSLAELEAQITELAGHLNAANYRWLTLIGEFDRRHGRMGNWHPARTGRISNAA
jgi:hypothetical protein